VRYDGLELLKAIITKYQNDELVATVSLQVLSALLLESGVDKKMMELEYKSVLQKLLDHYSADKFILTHTQRIMTLIERAESRVAAEEIR